MNKNIKPIIAIDPDVEKSGFAKLYDGILQIDTLRFPHLIELLRVEQGVKVLVEAGWLNEKSCFHEAQGRGAERIAKNVGANHQVGRLIIEMCQHYGLSVEAVSPLRKGWNGTNGKITHDELSRIEGLTVPARSNQEERDAALICLIHSGFPIKLRRKE